ncbi:hypothetical protein A2U01_0117705, partial [Trifolium medium]|nr:hypothetical protein [Trifolium medium]
MTSTSFLTALQLGNAG